MLKNVAPVDSIRARILRTASDIIRASYREGASNRLQAVTEAELSSPAPSSFPLHEIATMVETDDPLRPGSVAQTRAYYWESCTRQPWQLTPSLEGNGPHFISLNCPACTSEISAPWITEDNNGWAQRQFQASCPNCGMQVSKEVGVR